MLQARCLVGEENQERAATRSSEMDALECMPELAGCTFAFQYIPPS